MVVLRLYFPVLMPTSSLIASSQPQRLNLAFLLSGRGNELRTQGQAPGRSPLFTEWCTHERHSWKFSRVRRRGKVRERGGSLKKYSRVPKSQDPTKSDSGHMVPRLVSWPRVQTVHVVKLTFHIWLAHTGQLSFRVSLRVSEWTNVLTGLLFLGEPSLLWTWRRIKVGFEKSWCSPRHSVPIEFWLDFYLLWNEMLSFHGRNSLADGVWWMAGMQLCK